LLLEVCISKYIQGYGSFTVKAIGINNHKEGKKHLLYSLMHCVSDL